MPLAQLKETCAHEYSHAWVGENVPKERHARLARDAEEGFCELVGYLLMDSQNEELEKKRVLQNHYTRGQINLFIEAEQRYGFDEVLDWMKYGVAPQLEAGHVDELRDVRMPPAKISCWQPGRFQRCKVHVRTRARPGHHQTEGIMWGNRPVAIINGHSFLVNDLCKGAIGEHQRDDSVAWKSGKNRFGFRILDPAKNRNFCCPRIEIPGAGMAGQGRPFTFVMEATTL